MSGYEQLAHEAMELVRTGGFSHEVAAKMICRLKEIVPRNGPKKVLKEMEILLRGPAHPRTNLRQESINHQLQRVDIYG